jgi:hypothetical protein
MGAAARSFTMRWCRRRTQHAAHCTPGSMAAQRKCALWGTRAGFGNTSEPHGSTTPERVEGGAVPRCCVEAAAASLSVARAPSHLGRDCQLGWTCWTCCTSRTSWTLAATHLIIHHGPLYVARRRPRLNAALLVCLAVFPIAERRPQCAAAAAAAAHPGRAGIPLSIQLVGHESGPGSAEACLPNAQHARRQDLDSMPPHRPLSLHCLWRCSPTVSPTNAPHDDGLPISRDTCSLAHLRYPT